MNSRPFSVGGVLENNSFGWRRENSYLRLRRGVLVASRKATRPPLRILSKISEARPSKLKSAGLPTRQLRMAARTGSPVLARLCSSSWIGQPPRYLGP